LASLEILPPKCHLIDGRGMVNSPWTADPAELLAYTTKTQVLETFDFTAAARNSLLVELVTRTRGATPHFFLNGHMPG
jgi:hypothetical protein